MAHASSSTNRAAAIVLMIAVAILLAALSASLLGWLSSAEAAESRPEAVDEVLRDQPLFLLRFDEQQAADVQNVAAREGAEKTPQQGISIQGAALDTAGARPTAESKNSSLAFNGQGDVMVVQPSSEADKLEFSGAFTLELWVKPEDGGGVYQNLVSKGKFGADGRVHGALLYFGHDVPPVKAGTIRFDPAGDARQAIDSNARLTAGSWTHVAVTYEPDHGGGLCLYINGQLDAQRVGAITFPNCQGEPLTLGALAYDVGGQAWTNHFRGAVDDFVLYDRALPAERIRAHFSGPVLATPKFETDVQPILAAHCQGCHGGQTREADLDLRSLAGLLRGGANGPAIVRGQPGASILLDLIGRGEMPPEGEERLSSTEVALITRWIEGGAPADESIVELPAASRVNEEQRRFWSFTHPTQAAVPKAGAAGAENPIDAFLLARLETKGLTGSAAADRATLIRRAYFDLLGLSPSPEEVAAFERDEQAGAYERLIERLLESPHYGERWGRHWLDAAGYVDIRLYDGDAATTNVNEGIWRYRDYVIRSFNADKPFDRFITEQLAGDELLDWQAAEGYDDALRELLIATGYLRSVEDPTSEPQYGIKERYDVLFGLMEMVSSSLMGLTMECCRCHNHKYDVAIQQRDYYRLMAAFEPALNVHDWKKPAERVLADVSRGHKQQIDQKNGEIDQKNGELKGQVERVRQVSQQRLLSDRLGSLPEAIRADVKTAVETAVDKRDEVQKYLAEKFQAAVAVTAEQIDAGLTDAERSSVDSLKAEQDALQRQKRSYGMIQALWDVNRPPTSRLLRRGNPLSPGTLVSAGIPLVLTSADQEAELARPAETPGTSSGRRLALAHWITGPENPLTARVIVNRAWHHHFGRGIVATLGNFGHSGSPPTHPELLDWLAVDFQQHGWSLKRLHRQIMTSAAYRQQSRVGPEHAAAVAADPENLLLWRANLRRLEAETLRDALLAASGRLDRTMGGAPVMFTTAADGGSTTDSQRRSLYLLARRVYPLKFLEVFDSPIMPVNCVQRTSSATVLQTFAMINGGFVSQQAEHFSQRARAGEAADPAARLDLAYRIAFGRRLTAAEREKSLAFLSDQTRNYVEAGIAADEADRKAWAELCHMLLCSNEFLYVE